MTVFVRRSKSGISKYREQKKEKTMNTKKIFTTTLKSLLVVILFSIFTGCNVIKTDLLLPQLMVLRKVLSSVGLATDTNTGAGNPNTPVVTIDAPTFSPAAGTYTTTQSVTISTTTTGAILCYTTDGSTPSCDSTPSCSSGALYSSPVSIATTTTLKALACKAGNQYSAVGTGSYTIGSENLTLVYSSSSYTYIQNTAITTATPTFSGTATSCSSSPALPAGLTIDNTTCAISGTPTGTKAATAYTITASNAFGNTTANINISVIIAAPSALTYTGSPYSYSQNTAITTNTPTVTGTVTSCSASPVLPTGLSINNTTCAISGTPTVTQATTIHTITATNAGGNTTASISITVTAAPSALTYSSSSYTFKNNTAIATITPTVTGTVTSCSASPVLPTGLSINNTTCAISGTPIVNQGTTSYTITASNAGGSTTATFSIVVQTTVYKIFVTASTFNGDLRTAGGGGDGPAGADNLCNADANKPNTSSYKAILFANAIREAKPTLTNWVLQANTVYVRGSDSAPIFTTNASSNFTFGALTNSFDSGAQKQYWTGFGGSGNEWELGLYRCNEWQSSSGVVTGRFGLSDATSYSSISTGAQNNCNTSKYLLCAEQ